jgi:hypothetical protein
VASLDELARIAEIEFSEMVETTETMGTKLRIMLIKNGFIDVWVGRILEGRFGFHWEEESTGKFYRYDNFPDTNWVQISTYPCHFHDGSQNTVRESSEFQKDIYAGFRDFMKWVRSRIG